MTSDVLKIMTDLQHRVDEGDILAHASLQYIIALRAHIDNLTHEWDEWRTRAMDRCEEAEKWFRKYAAEQQRADNLEAKIAALNDPLVIQVNMLRGSIAKPSAHLMAHVYAGQLFTIEQVQAERYAQIELASSIIVSKLIHHELLVKSESVDPSIKPLAASVVEACKDLFNQIQNQLLNRSALENYLQENKKHD